MICQEKMYDYHNRSYSKNNKKITQRIGKKSREIIFLAFTD